MIPFISLCVAEALSLVGLGSSFEPVNKEKLKTSLWTWFWLAVVLALAVGIYLSNNYQIGFFPFN